jgi:predicted phage terminase large subunit-like protein
MQRLHEDDVSGHLLNKNLRIRHICLPAEASAAIHPAELTAHYSQGLLDPIRMDTGILHEISNNIGSYAYAGQFLQQPAPLQGGLIRKHWFGTYRKADLPTDIVWNIVADTAYTSDEKNDPSGLLAYGYYEGKWHLREWTAVYMEFPELVKFFPEFAARNGCAARSVVIIEPKASGKSLVQTLRRNTGLNVVEDAPPSRDKTARAQDISPVVEGGHILLPEGASWANAFVDELAHFPNAAHDEAMDCLVIMINRHLKEQKKTWMKWM